MFTRDDMGGDKVLIEFLLYIVIAIIAFIFAVTISNTIASEAAVIGTLRASGYKRSEIVIHYMAGPLIVTGVAAVIGNVLGYTVFKKLWQICITEVTAFLHIIHCGALKHL